MSFHWYLHRGPKATVRDYLILETERLGPWFVKHWFMDRRFLHELPFPKNASETERKVMPSGHSLDTAN